MDRISVGLGERSYEIIIGDGLIEHSIDHLAPFVRNGRFLLISDDNVWRAAGQRLQDALVGTTIVPVIVRAGEESKSWSGLADVVDQLLAHGVERSDHIIAFGGGVVGDLGGFAAAIANRGCNFVQIPTTLLAQVDSSVGGKTAINVAAGKNLVGAFHQPSLVLIDPSLLGTLSLRELRSGYAEIAKYGLIEDRDFFDWLEQHGAALIAGDGSLREHAIARAVAGKARIVEADERETSGRRALLNLGHTFGHALEAETGYSDRLLHGEAVALGCVLAFAFSVSRGLADIADAQRVRKHFVDVGLPTTLSEVGLKGRGVQLTRHMERDKKRANGKTAFILAHAIGDVFVDKGVELADVAAFLDEAQ